MPETPLCAPGVVSHSRSPVQCAALIFLYWQEPADLGLPWHTCITHGRPKIHTQHICTGTLFIPMADVHEAFSSGTMAGVELTLLLLVHLQGAWKAVSSPESRGFTAGVLGQTLGVLPTAIRPWLVQNSTILQVEHWGWVAGGNCPKFKKKCEAGSLR